MVELNGPTDQSEAASGTGFMGESAQVQRPVPAGDKPLDCAQVSTDFRNNVFAHPVYDASHSLMGKTVRRRKCVRTRTEPGSREFDGWRQDGAIRSGHLCQTAVV